MYAAYLLIVGGFLLSYTSWWNGFVALTWLTVRVTRIRREEALLCRDEQYLRQTQRAWWRLVPRGVVSLFTFALLRDSTYPVGCLPLPVHVSLVFRQG